MNLESFTDELLSLRAGESLVKMAKAQPSQQPPQSPQEHAKWLAGWRAHYAKSGFTPQDFKRDFAKEIGSVKTAGKSRLFERFGTIGAASGLGTLGLAHGRAALTDNPWDTPREKPSEAAIKGAMGGLTAAGVIKLLGMLANKGKRR